jgi:hypothetical protein
MLSLFGKVCNSNWALITISIVVILTVLHSEFIKLFYGTNLDNPGSFHLSLFLTFIIIVSAINIACLRFVRINDIEARTSRSVVFRIAYSGTIIIQYGILVILILILAEMLILQVYDKLFILLVVYLSHFWSAILLTVLSSTFVQWFKFTRSFAMLIYGVVFMVVLFLILTTIPLLTEQFTLQSRLIYPKSYTNLILDTIVPSNNISFIFGLGNYVLPVMIISSWILTVSLLKVYAYRIGRMKFWLIASIPLLFQFFLFIVRNPDFVADPNMVQIIYSKQFQFILGIGYTISGLFFAIGFLIIGMKMKRKKLKAYLIISAIGIASLFSSMQPGMPFYAAYPPFGLVTLMFLGLSSYMLLVGILGSAAYISNDSELRREISKGLDPDSDVLKKMGSAEIHRDIERRILPLADKVKMSTDIEYPNMEMDREELKILIDDVLNEVYRGSHTRRNKY